MGKVKEQQLTNTGTSLKGLQLYSTQFISCCLNSVHPVLQTMKRVAIYDKMCWALYKLSQA